MPPSKATKPLRKKPTAAQLQKREQSAFSRRIRTTFSNAGFVYLPTEGIHRMFGSKKGELDSVFIFENVILVCEDTIEKSPRDHLKNKKLLADEIASNPNDLITWLRSTFADQLASVEEFDLARYQIFFLYFSKTEILLTAADQKLFEPVRVVSQATLSYFSKMSQNIRRSSRSDIFRYLGLKNSDLGPPEAGNDSKTIPTSIIYPAYNTGLQNGVRIVSFMMSAEMLLKNSFVLRKDNWEDSIELYQRLIEKDRIQKIRKYLAQTKSTFINNIIVSLPSEIEFKNDAGASVSIDDVAAFGNHTMHIPDELNSICVIDGQHRIFAHYEGDDVLEPEIAKLRKKFHLLVTGIIFPPAMPQLQRRTFESEMFLDINSNARPVPQDVLLSIVTLREPFSDLGIARQVIQRLNELDPFLGRFQLALLDDGKIKIASIIKFALRRLVEITEDVDRPSLFAHWGTAEQRSSLTKDKDEKNDRVLLDEYVDYCAQVLAQYFNAVRVSDQTAWNDPDSRILSTTAINGYILALRGSLPSFGVLDFADYRERITKVNISFSKATFPYASSQYGKFSRQILSEAFGIEPPLAAEATTDAE